MKFVLTGAPTTKKTSNRIMRFGRFNKVMPSERFIAWQERVVPELKTLWNGRPPISEPLHVRAVFYRERELGDLLGFEQALADVMQVEKRDPETGKVKRHGGGLITDDKLILSWDGSRIAKDAKNPRVEFELLPFEDER